MIKQQDIKAAKHYFSLFILLFLSGTLVFFSRKNIFFWDTVQLASEHATWFYDNNFSTIFLPTNIDSGHIPALGWYLAECWRIFGKTLLVSHISILPFVWLIVFWEWKIAGIYFSGGKRNLLCLLLFLEPTLLAQFTLVSSDDVLIAFFLMHLWAILSQHKKWRLLSAVFLVLISLRGAIVLVALEFFLLLLSKTKKYFTKEFVFILPALTLWLLYQYFHLHHSGWIGWHSDSPWSESFEWTNPDEFLRNTVIFVWRMLDFGRFSLYIIFFLIFIYKGKSILEETEIKKLLLLLAILLIFFYGITVPHRYLSAHRYFIPVYIVFSLILFISIDKFIEKKRLKIVAYSFAIINLIAGHFWIYPDKIAQGWDSSLAYIPYIKIWPKVERYLQSNKIPKENIGSDFPNLSPTKYMNLSTDSSHFKTYNMKSDSFILYSNIFNSFTDAEIDSLKHWKIMKDFSKGRIKVILYKKK